MVLVSGDTHARFNRFSGREFKYRKENGLYVHGYEGCTPDNTFIFICGDFGGVWSTKPNGPEHSYDKWWLNWLSTKPVTFIVVGGNHENWDAIEANYPISEWCGARVRFLRDNVVWVERGEIITIEGKRFWCFGGAESTDKIWRAEGSSWWAHEEATEEEFEYGLKTFEENWDNIDYIITHAAPSQVTKLFYGANSGASRTDQFLNRIWWLNKRCVPHFCGHLHHNFHFDMYGYDVQILYEDIMELPKSKLEKEDV